MFLAVFWDEERADLVFFSSFVISRFPELRGSGIVGSSFRLTLVILGLSVGSVKSIYLILKRLFDLAEKTKENPMKLMGLFI
jgi:hypothetical protein